MNSNVGFLKQPVNSNHLFNDISEGQKELIFSKIPEELKASREFHNLCDIVFQFISNPDKKKAEEQLVRELGKIPQCLKLLKKCESLKQFLAQARPLEENDFYREFESGLLACERIYINERNRTITELFSELGKDLNSKKLHGLNHACLNLLQEPDLGILLESTINCEANSKFSRLRKFGDITLLIGSYYGSKKREILDNQNRLDPKDMELQKSVETIRNAYNEIMQSSHREAVDPLKEAALLLNLASDSNLENFSILKSGKTGLKVDNKLLGLVLGSHFITDFSYTSEDQSAVMTFIATSLFNRFSNEKDPVYLNLSRLLAKGSQFRRNFQRNDDKAFEEFYALLTQNLNSNDQNLLLPLHFTDRLQIEHFIYLEISARNTGLFNVRIYNTGVSAAKFNPFVDEGEKYIIPYIEIQNVAKEKITNKAFAQAFFEFNNLTVAEESDLQFSPEDFYHFLFESLGGEIARPIETKDLMRVPIADNSVLGGITAALKFRLSPLQFTQLNIEIGLDSLCNYYRSNFENLNNEELHLLKRSCVSFGQQALDAYHNRAIDDEKLKTIYATLQELLSEISRKQKINNPREIPFHLDYSVRNTDFGNILPIESFSSEKYNNHYMRPSSLYFDFKDLDDLKNLSAVLDKFNNHQKLALSHGKIEIAKANFHALFEILAMKDVDNFVPGLSKESEDLMIKLSRLNDLLFQTRGTEDESDLNTYSHYLFLISYKLSQKVDSLKYCMNGTRPPVFEYNRKVYGEKGRSGGSGDQNLYSSFKRKLRKKIVAFVEEAEKMKNQGLEEFFIFTPRDDFEFQIDMRGMNLSFPFQESYSYKKEAEFVFYEFKNNYQFRERFYNAFPNFRYETDETCVVQILCDLDGKILNKAHAALRKQALICRLIEYRLIKPDNNPNPIELEINYDRTSLVPNNAQLMCLEKNPALNDYSLDALVEIARRTKNYSIGSLISEQEIMEEKFIEWDSFSRIDRDEDKYPMHEIADLLLLMTHGDMDNEDPHREQQVIKLISYFSNNIDKLRDPKIQKFFKLLFFEGDYLETIIKNNPIIEQKITEFFEHGWSNFFERKELETACFFIEINGLFNEIAKPLLQRNLREFLMDKILKGEWNSRNKSFLYQQVIASYITDPPANFSQEDALLLVKALAYSHAFLADETISPQTKEHIFMAMSWYRKAIKTHFTGSEGPRLCQSVIQEILPSASNVEWDCETSYPVCVSDKYDLNVLDGILTGKHGSFSDLPNDVLSHPLFPADLYDPSQLAENLGNNCYRFKDKLGVETEIFYDPYDFRLEIKQKIGNEFYLLINDESVLARICHPGLPFGVYHILKYNQIWAKTGIEACRELILKDKNRKPKYRIKLENSPGYRSTVHINKCEDIGNPLSPLELIDIYNRENSFSLGSNRALCWKSKNGLLKLEFPSMDLTFTMVHKTPAYCKEMPGFFISPSQKIEGLNLPSQFYFVLENPLGQRKVVIALGKIIQARGSLSVNYSIEENFKIKKISYDLDAKRNIKANSIEQKAYLTSLLLAEKKYGEALETLRQIEFSHIPLTKQEIRLLNELYFQLDRIRDKSPEGAALILKVATLLPKKQVLKASIREYLSIYTSFKHTIPTLALLPQEEKIANHLSNYLKQDASLVSLPIVSHPHQKERYECIIPFMGPKKLSPLWMEIGNLKNWFSEALREDGSRFQLTRPGNLFPKYFMIYYRMAKQSDNQVSWVLNLILGDKRVDRRLIQLLLAVYRNPHNFPAAAQVEMMIKTNNEEAFLQLIRAGDEYPESFLPNARHDKSSLRIEKSIHPRLENAQNVSLREKSVTCNLSPIEPSPPLLKDHLLHSVFEEKPTGGLQLSEASKDALITSLIGDQANISVEGAKVANEINAYWTAPERNHPWHRIKEAELQKVKLHLQIEKSEAGKRLSIESAELLHLANALPQELKKMLVQGTERIGELRSEVTLNDLYIAAIRYKSFTLTATNPHLADREKDLIQKTVELLAHQAHFQQIGRAIDCVNALEKAEGKGEEEYFRLSEALYQEINRKLPYHPHEHPEFVLFEVLTGFGLFAEQVKDLIELNAADANYNLILQKVMGAGKTKVYLSILALLKADGKKIPFVVVPASQYNTVAQAMEIQSGKIFHQKARALTFEDKQIANVEGLYEILEELQSALKNQDFFVVTDKALHKFNTAFKKTWYEFLIKDQPDEALTQKLKAFEEIRALICGRGIFDEADLLLACNQEFILALGEKESINPAHCKLVADIYETIKDTLALNEPFTIEKYQKRVKNACIMAFAKKIKQYIPVENAGLAMCYLMGQKQGENYVETLEPEVRNLLAIAFHEFDKLLSLTVSKRTGEHFGYSDLIQKLYIVPYLASGIPSKTSDFSFPYTLLNFSLQALKEEGININLLKKIVEGLQEKALTEDPSKKLVDTATYAEFKELCCHSVVIPFYDFTMADLEKLKAHYLKDQEASLIFAKKYIFPEIKLYRHLIKSTSFSLCRMFDEIVGFSGTPWNEKLYIRKGRNALTTKIDPASSGKTLGIMWMNSFELQEFKECNDLKKTVSSVAELQDRQGGGFHAFIDAGALFLGYENEEVAQELLKHNPSVKGIVFFKDNLPHVIERNKIGSIPYTRSSLRPEEIYIYYDQWHTTGTDLPIAGKSFLSVGKTTLRRDLEQAYMRDRNAEKGKRVCLLIPEKVKTHIFEELNIKDTPLYFGHVLSHVEGNQERELDEQKMPSVLGQMKNILEFHLDKILSTQTNPLKLLHKRDEVLAILTEDNRDSPYEKFGRLNELCEREKAFQFLIDQVLNKIRGLSEVFPEIDMNAVKKDLEACIDLELYPEKVRMGNSDSNHFSECQTQQQNRQQQLAVIAEEVEEMPEIACPERACLTIQHLDWKPPYSNTADYYRICSLDELAGILNSGGLYDLMQINVPIMRISDIFRINPSLYEYKDVFNIEFSHNFLRVLNPYSDSNFDNAVPFEKSQTQVKFVLILQQAGQEPRLILIDQADEGYFYSQLGKERENHARSDLSVTLYDMRVGIIQSNDPAIQANHIFDEKTVMLIAQAKFFNGELIYTKNELSMLSVWFRQVGISKMKNLFTRHIMTFKAKEHKNKFSKSPLAKLFKTEENNHSGNPFLNYEFVRESNSKVTSGTSFKEIRNQPVEKLKADFYQMEYSFEQTGKIEPGKIEEMHVDSPDMDGSRTIPDSYFRTIPYSRLGISEEVFRHLCNELWEQTNFELSYQEVGSDIVTFLTMGGSINYNQPDMKNPIVLNRNDLHVVGCNSGLCRSPVGMAFLKNLNCHVLDKVIAGGDTAYNSLVNHHSPALPSEEEIMNFYNYFGVSFPLRVGEEGYVQVPINPFLKGGKNDIVEINKRNIRKEVQGWLNEPVHFIVFSRSAFSTLRNLSILAKSSAVNSFKHVKITFLNWPDPISYPHTFKQFGIDRRIEPNSIEGMKEFERILGNTFLIR